MSDNLTSLESLVKKWALKQVDRDARHLKVNIDLDNVTFSCAKPVFEKTKRKYETDPKVVFTSTVTNNTDTTHVSSISVKRSTPATGHITLKHGLIADHIFGTKLETPPEARGLFDRSVDIDLEETNKVEHTMDWSFTSVVRAGPRKVTKTSFEVKEEKLTADFSTYVHVKGPVTVEVKDKFDDEVLLSETETIRNIIDETLPPASPSYPPNTQFETLPASPTYTPNTQFQTFVPLKDPIWMEEDPNSIYVEEDFVRWPVRGQMSFQYGITQNERVE